MNIPPVNDAVDIWFSPLIHRQDLPAFKAALLPEISQPPPPHEHLVDEAAKGGRFTIYIESVNRALAVTGGFGTVACIVYERISHKEAQELFLVLHERNFRLPRDEQYMIDAFNKVTGRHVTPREKCTFDGSRIEERNGRNIAPKLQQLIYPEHVLRNIKLPDDFNLMDGSFDRLVAESAPELREFWDYLECLPEDMAELYVEGLFSLCIHLGIAKVQADT